MENKAKIDLCLNCTRPHCNGVCERFPRHTERKKKGRRGGKRYDVRGESHTMHEWAEIYGIDPGTLYNRVERYGWTMEEAVATAPGMRVRGRLYEAFGEAHTLREWADLRGMSLNALNHRVRAWGSLEKALTVNAPPLLPKGQAAAAPGDDPKDRPGLVAPAGRGSGATALPMKSTIGRRGRYDGKREE